jgi:hypothetical protein
MSDLARIIKMAIVGSFGCPHLVQPHGCPECLAKVIAETVINEAERKTNGILG